MCFAGLTLGLLAQITVLVVGICMLLYVYVLSSVGFVCECVCVCVCALTRTHPCACMHVSVTFLQDHTVRLPEGWRPRAPWALYGT